jgi:hypothetical protein
VKFFDLTTAAILMVTAIIIMWTNYSPDSSTFAALVLVQLALLWIRAR